MGGLSNGLIPDLPRAPWPPKPGFEKLPFQIVSELVGGWQKMSIEHIWGYIGWLWSDTAFAKAPNEWKQIEHNMCGRWAARSPLWWWPCYDVPVDEVFFFVSLFNLALGSSGFRGVPHLVKTFSCWGYIWVTSSRLSEESFLVGFLLAFFSAFHFTSFQTPLNKTW